MGVVAVNDNDENHSITKRFFLKQNYPNPFNPETTIHYELARATRVEIRIYNALGQEIRTLINQVQNAGSFAIDWDGRTNWGNLATSGIYVLEMKAGEFSQMRKMMMVR